MKPLAKICSCVLSAVLLAALLSVPAAAAQNGSKLDHTALTQITYWTPAVDNHLYNLYRLPGIVVTKRDTVIIYGEGRKTSVNRDDNNADKCEMDLYIRRSTDGGRTFGSPIYIAKGEEYYNKGLGETINNPAMIVGADGRLHLLYCCDVGDDGVFYTYSNDDGLTWSEPRDLRDELEPAMAWTMLAFGPGHGVCLDSGRLVVPVWAYYGGSYSVYTMYSDDNGSSWHFGKRASNNRDETAIARTSDGGVLLNSRQYSTPNASSPYRMLTSSLDGISGWSNSAAHTALIDPACAGGMCSVEIEGLPHAVLFTNNASTTSRNHITVRCSFDDGLTWEKSLLIDEKRGGYSDIAVDSKGKVYVIYETAMGSTVILATFSFWDAFCAGDAALVSEQTDFTNLAPLVSEAKNVSATAGENGEAKIAVTKAGEASASLDLTGTSRNLSADRTPVVALTVRTDGTQTGSAVKCGAYLRCGRTGKSLSALYQPFTVANDGRDHTVLLDFSEMKLCRGNLYSLALEFFSLEIDAEAGDGYVISRVAFFGNMEQAEAAFPPEAVPVESDTEAETASAPVTTDAATAPAGAAEPATSGCQSVAAGAALPLAAVAALSPVFRKRRRKTAGMPENREI